MWKKIRVVYFTLLLVSANIKLETLMLLWRKLLSFFFMNKVHFEFCRLLLGTTLIYYFSKFLPCFKPIVIKYSQELLLWGSLMSTCNVVDGEIFVESLPFIWSLIHFILDIDTSGLFKHCKQAGAKIRSHICGTLSWLQPVCIQH